MSVSVSGSSISISRLPGYFTNIFDAGYIASPYLDNEVVKGRHQPIISLDLFCKVNGLNSGVKYNSSGLQQERPLQGFVLCSCGSKYTGYKKKSKYNYYKCNGCKTNISSTILDDSFESLLNKYAFKELPIPLLKKQLRYTYDYIYQETISNNKYISERIIGNDSSPNSQPANTAVLTVFIICWVSEISLTLFPLKPL